MRKHKDWSPPLSDRVAPVTLPVRVLYLNPNPNRASSTVPLEGWLEVLGQRGLQPTVITSRNGPFHQWARGAGIDADALPLPWPSFRESLKFALSMGVLTVKARRSRIQLVHCVEQSAYPFGRFLARICGLPLLVSVVGRLDRPFCRWAFSGSRRPRRIIFVSHGNLEDCRPAMAGLVPEADWRVIPNCVDLRHHRPDPEAGTVFRTEHGFGTTPIVGVACALRPVKQLDHLLEAAARLPQHVHLALAGGPIRGEEWYADKILRRGRLLLGNRFHALGHLDDLHGFLNALDVFVNTSAGEAGSLSVIQALASGCPVIGYPSSSVVEMVLPGGGEIVPQDNVAELTQALRRWLGNPALLAAGRVGARRRAEADYDVRLVADRLWSVYQEVLA
jgi:glycosyltransferase involved in cell wall biosynthesis